MTYTVQILHAEGRRVETFATGVTEKTAEAMAAHPGLSGLVVLVVPDFAALPVG